MKKLALLASLLLASCQQEASTESVGTSVAGRAQLALAADSTYYSSATWVRVHLVAGGFDQTRTSPFNAKSCVFDGVPVDVPFTLSFQGLNADSTRVLWTGSRTGTTAVSGGAAVSADVAVYTLHDTTLAQLTVPVGVQLSPAFTASVHSYTASVPAGTQTFSLVPVGTDTTNTVTCNGGSCSSIPLSSTSDTTPIVVNVLNPYGNTSSYSIAVVRGAPVSVERDSLLAALSTTPGVMTTSFAPSTLAYVDSVPSGTDSISVVAIPRNANDVQSVRFQGDTGRKVKLDTSRTTQVQIEVVNKNNHSATYVLTVVRMAPATTASDSLLSALSTTPGTLSTAFSPTTLSYVDTVLDGTDSVVVTATARTAADIQSIRVNGDTGRVVRLAATDPTPIAVVVTNKNANAATYALSVVRKPVPRDSLLGALSTTPGVFAAPFSATTSAYVDSVPAGTDSVRVVAVARTPADVREIRIDGDTAHVVKLAATGTTTIAVEVVDRNGKSATYTVSVVHMAPAATARDSLLSVLSTTPGTFTAKFSPATLSYTDTVPSGTDSITVTATARTEADVQSIRIAGDTAHRIGLDASGTTRISVVVTNRNANATTYQLTVFRRVDPDTSHPVYRRSAGTQDTVVTTSAATLPVSWTVTDNALQSVTIDGTRILGTSPYSMNVPLAGTGDSLWVKMVAVDSSNNTSRDSILVYRLAPFTATATTGTLTGRLLDVPSNGTGALQFSNPIPSATLQLSSDFAYWISQKTWTGASGIVYTKTRLRSLTLQDSIVILVEPGFSVKDSSLSAPGSTLLNLTGVSGAQYTFDTTSGWSAYTTGNGISLNRSTTLYARTTLGGYASRTVRALFVVPPTTSPATGATSVDTLTVHLSDAGADSMQASLDGFTWQPYPGKTGSIVLHSSTMLQVRSWRNGTASGIATSSYTISHDTLLQSAVVADGRSTWTASISGNTIALADSVHGLDTVVTLRLKAHGAFAKVLVDSGTDSVIHLSAGKATSRIYVVDGNSVNRYDLTVVAHALDTITDSRDQQTYPVARIGKQWWMAENLNYNPGTDSSWCFHDSLQNCAELGRLYSWHTAMGLDRGYDTLLWAGTSNQQGACPTGWHVPFTKDWDSLFATAGGADPAVLMDTGFYGGTDIFGFKAIPSGVRTGAGVYQHGPGDAVNMNADFWTATEYTANAVQRLQLSNSTMYWYPANGINASIDKRAGFSLRCLRN
jgi:uncharacterized protein (TIGR02145 family)